MPTRLKGRRPRGVAGALSPREKQAIEGWFIEGLSVSEVYARCIDEGIDPPQEQALYRILNSELVQSGLRSRQAAESALRIARIVERTKSRNEMLLKIIATVEARGVEYAGLVPGGDQGLVVLSDRKTLRTGVESFEVFDLYKTDGALIEAWRSILEAQERADEALWRNLRSRRVGEMAQEKHEQESELRSLDIELRRLEVLKRQAEIALATARNVEGTYQPPTFPAVIVEALPNPVRPDYIDEAAEEEEGVVPEIPWPLLEEMNVESGKASEGQRYAGGDHKAL